MNEAGGRLRLFFALWPPAAVREALATASRRLHESCGGRMTRPESIHLTLSFLGEVPERQLPALRAAAGAVRGHRFELLFDHAEYWRHNRVAWAGCSRQPTALAMLAEGLAERLAPLGFPPETRPFAAHVTLLRKALCPAKASSIEPVAWPVEDFVLVRSVLERTGAVYEVLERWPLPA